MNFEWIPDAMRTLLEDNAVQLPRSVTDFLRSLQGSKGAIQRQVCVGRLDH